MASGRKRKPTNDKVLQGTFRKDRANPNEPGHEISKLEPPEFIKTNEYAIKEWEKVSPGLSNRAVVATVGEGAVERYCMVYARWRQAEYELSLLSLTDKTSNGNNIQNPLVGIANKAAELSNKLAVELGLTSASASKVSGIPKGKKKDGWDDM